MEQHTQQSKRFMQMTLRVSFLTDGRRYRSAHSAEHMQHNHIHQINLIINFNNQFSIKTATPKPINLVQRH